MEDGSGFTVSLDETGTGGSRSGAMRGQDRAAPGRRAFHTRRRGRRGRGMRTPMLPASVPGARSRAGLFDQYVADSAERLHQLWGLPIESVEFRVEDIPPGLEELAAAGERVPLGDVSADQKGAASSIVIYRHPVQTAARGHGDMAELVHDVVVEQAAVLLGTTPEAVDPMYGRFGA